MMSFLRLQIIHMHQTYKNQQHNTACNLLTYRTIRGKCVLWEEHTAEP